MFCHVGHVGNFPARLGERQPYRVSGCCSTLTDTLLPCATPLTEPDVGIRQRSMTLAAPAQKQPVSICSRTSLTINSFASSLGGSGGGAGQPSTGSLDRPAEHSSLLQRLRIASAMPSRTSAPGVLEEPARIPGEGCSARSGTRGDIVNASRDVNHLLPKQPPRQLHCLSGAAAPSSTGGLWRLSDAAVLVAVALWEQFMPLE